MKPITGKGSPSQPHSSHGREQEFKCQASQTTGTSLIHSPNIAHQSGRNIHVDSWTAIPLAGSAVPEREITASALWRILNGGYPATSMILGRQYLGINSSMIVTVAYQR
jgi:hypothetical protein